MPQTIVASYKNWAIAVDVLEESDSVLTVLLSNGKVVAASESTFDLLKECSENVAKELRMQLIQRDIAEYGGAAKYKEVVYQNQLKYGTSCYDELDVETLRAYAELGIYLSSKL
jgi:hypothetical protein